MNKARKNFIWNLIGSTFNSFTSLFFMIIVTRINGTDIAGIFTFAFSFACLMQVISNYAGRSYQVTELDESIGDSDFVYSRIVTCILMILCSILFLLVRGYSKYKIMVMFLLILFRVIESLAEVLYGIIQKNNSLYQVGVSLFWKGFLSVVLFFIVDYFTKDLLLSIGGIIAINLLILFIYDKRNVLACHFHFSKIDLKKIKKILCGGFFVFIFTFLTQYVMNASKYAIDGLLSNEAQTIYGILSMPATIMLLCSQFLVQPFLVTLTEHLKENRMKQFASLVFRLALATFGFGILAEIVCYFLGIPVLELVYGIELSDYKVSLLVIVLGATFFGISYIISTSLVAMRKNMMQTVIYGLVSIFTLVLSNYFVRFHGIMGATIAYFCTMCVLLFFYIIYFCYCVHRRKNL